MNLNHAPVYVWWRLAVGAAVGLVVAIVVAVPTLLDWGLAGSRIPGWVAGLALHHLVTGAAVGLFAALLRLVVVNTRTMVLVVLTAAVVGSLPSASAMVSIATITDQSPVGPLISLLIGLGASVVLGTAVVFPELLPAWRQYRSWPVTPYFAFAWPQGCQIINPVRRAGLVFLLPIVAAIVIFVILVAGQAVSAGGDGFLVIAAVVGFIIFLITWVLISFAVGLLAWIMRGRKRVLPAGITALWTAVLIYLISTTILGFFVGTHVENVVVIALVAAVVAGLCYLVDRRADRLAAVQRQHWQQAYGQPGQAAAGYAPGQY